MRKHFTYGAQSHNGDEGSSFWLCPPQEFYPRCHAEQTRLSNSRFGRLDSPAYAPSLAEPPGTQAKRDRARKELLEQQHKFVGIVSVYGPRKRGYPR